MDITWLGHSCFRIRAGELALVTDPFPDSLGFSMGRPAGQIVTVSHEHPHHNHVAGMTGDPYQARTPGEYEVSGIYVKGVRTPPGPSDPHDKRNTAYVVDLDGVRICHLGDLSRGLSARALEEIGTVDVLLAPAGGGCTLPPAELPQVVSTLGPRIIIPMHYRTPHLAADLGLEGPETFLRELGAANVEPVTRLTVTPTNLPPEPRVALLQQTSRPRE